MTEIYYDSTHFTDFVQTLSRHFKTKVTDGQITLPSNVGEGYLKAVHLPAGISILISDIRFREDTLLNRSMCQGEQFYILEFNEAIEAPTMYSTPKVDAYNILKQMVLLTHTGVAGKYFVPANARLLSYKIMFQRKHLLQFIDEQVVDNILSKYFLEVVQSGAVEPLDVEYRSLLKELINNNSIHPLSLNFIQNRTFLLIEKFLVKLFEAKKSSSEKLKLSDNEIVRLMKIESMLVNDFSVTPPNINYLSRISAMSPTKLKTDFKRLYGMPIYEYYQKNRMQRAKMLLMEGKYSIKEVGIKVGYSNLSHFAGSFKKEFGLLPSELLAKDGALAI